MVGVGGRADQVLGVEENAEAIVDLREGIREASPLEQERRKGKGRVENG